MTIERIKELRREARALNAKAKAKARASGQQWSKMDDEDLRDLRRYAAIYEEIAQLKAAGHYA